MTPNAPRLRATVTLDVNGLRRVTLVTLANRNLTLYDVSNDKVVTIKQTNIRDPHGGHQWQPLTTGIAIVTTSASNDKRPLRQATVTLDSSDTTVSITLPTPGFTYALNTLNLSVTSGMTASLSAASQVTVVDCRITNGMLL